MYRTISSAEKIHSSSYKSESISNFYHSVLQLCIKIVDNGEHLLRSGISGGFKSCRQVGQHIFTATECPKCWRQWQLLSRPHRSSAAVGGSSFSGSQKSSFSAGNAANTNSFASAASNAAPIAIIRLNNENNGDGSYKFE